MSKINLIDAEDLVSKIVDKLQTNEVEKPLSVTEIANFLGFSPNYIRRLCQERKIPHKKLEGKNGPILMFKSEIKEWIDKHKVKTLDKIIHESN